jgi:hypothetical protein
LLFIFHKVYPKSNSNYEKDLHANLLAFSVSNIFSQTFYQKTIALARNPNNWNGGTPYLAKQTTDHGIIFTGSYYNNGISDSSTFLTKLDANLAVQWSVGLYLAQDPQPYALLQTKISAS